MNRISAAVLVLSVLVSTSHAFTMTRTSISTSPTKLWSAVGGWGIGQSRELTEGEMVRGDRRAYDGYELKDRGDFMRQVKEDRQKMFDDEKDELLMVARMAGIDVKPSNKFDDDTMGDNDIDDIDLSVTWDDEDQFDVQPNFRRQDESSVNDVSITRMDEDTGAPGSW